MTAAVKGKVVDDLIQFVGPESPTILSSLDITITRPQVKLARATAKSKPSNIYNNKKQNRSVKQFEQ